MNVCFIPLGNHENCNREIVLGIFLLILKKIHLCIVETGLFYSISFYIHYFFQSGGQLFCNISSHIKPAFILWEFFFFSSSSKGKIGHISCLCIQHGKYSGSLLQRKLQRTSNCGTFPC